MRIGTGLRGLDKWGCWAQRLLQPSLDSWLPSLRRSSPSRPPNNRLPYERTVRLRTGSGLPSPRAALLFCAVGAMAATQASLGVSCPSSLIKSSFLAGSSASRLSRAAFKSIAAPSAKPLRVEAKKGQWLPGVASPSYLDGSLPGDNGFDPLNLGEEPAYLRWFVQAELQNGRWAMLGVAGILIPDILKQFGILSIPAWYDAGKAEYFAPASTLFVIEVILFHYAEVRRWQDIKYPGSVNADPFNPSLKLPPGEVGYPGGIFNPLNFPSSFEYKEKEIANGRLAMMAFLGFLVQYNVTGKGPMDNLFEHLRDPIHNNIIQTLLGS